ncbi:MAG TPA: hypothetical protein VLM37_05730, partial [Fibrobacteraceae bacterium]|nr:hypothetical protein [Fibrobacteraceae bacterium]
ADLADTHVPEAYERLLLDVMQGDATLFALGDAVETCWQFIDPILQYHDAGAPLHIYPAGSWGPREADDLLSRDQRQWRYPCKNLAEEGACVL